MSLKKVLFVDDDPRILSAMRRRLSSAFNVVTFERGLDAVEYLKDNQDTSVMVADMRMPEMDGLEVLKRSQEIHPGLKRIMLTGNADQQTAIDAINQGKVFKFLRKPCDAQDVKAAIELAIEESEFAETDIPQITEKLGSEFKDENQQELFLSVMSEELRTPLSQVISISDTLNRQELDINDRARARMLRQIGEAGQNALARVDRILSFVKLQSASVKALENDIQLDVLAIEEINRIRPVAAERGVTISFEANKVPVRVKSNPESIRIALREALNNAIKFNKENGHISVQIKSNEHKAAMRITNTGRKISKDISISNQVFKAENIALNRGNYGMGLGLSLINAAAVSGDFNYDFWPRDNGGAWVTFVFESVDR